MGNLLGLGTKNINNTYSAKRKKKTHQERKNKQKKGK